MTTNFADLLIKKVTPGKPSRYFSDIGITRKKDKSVIRKSVIRSVEQQNVSADLTLHLRHIKISNKCKAYLNGILKGANFLKIKWNYRKFSQVVQSPEALYDENVKIKLDFTALYKLEMNVEFLDSHYANPIIFELFAVDSVKEVKISTAELYMVEPLATVNKKEYARVLFCSEEIDPKESFVAYLDLWYKISCNKKLLRDLYASLKCFLNLRKSKSTIFSVSDLDTSADSLHVTSSEVDHFADNLLLVLNRNKVLKTSQTEINNTLEERVRWLRYEANWKQTLQEHAILHGKNPHSVTWRQWREEDTVDVRLRTYDKLKPTVYKPELSITLEKLYFLEGSAPLRKEAIQQVYVEYNFLGLEGPEMETPFSLPKGTMEHPTMFQWTKIFDIDIEKNYETCYTLSQWIKNNRIIKFLVISEPQENIDKPIQTCEEIGYAEVPLEEVIQLEENIDSYEYEILDFYNPIAVVGYLTVKFDGILAMRKMALTVMAPKGYKLFM